MSLEQAPDVSSQSPEAGFSVATAPSGQSDERLADVFRITKEIFGFEPTTEVMFDPEDPDWSWTVINVHSRGEPKELVQRQIQWHQQLAALDRNHSLRISIHPVK